MTDTFRRVLRIDYLTRVVEKLKDIPGTKGLQLRNYDEILGRNDSFLHFRSHGE